ncbi:MAG TPA: DNA polymerase III subunit delta [Gammaproteobacteria bacterium]|nr:DNA polymerase III subunit delta [Gammaproteobacteria bacterium]
MKLAPERLAGQLKTRLAPVYLIAGEEPLQRDEAADAVRAAARAQGYTEREVFEADRVFDWNLLRNAGASLSLFASRRVLDVRLASAKPGDEGAETLTAYAADPAPDTILLVTCGKLERGGGAWAAALEQAGVMVQVWPVDARQLPAWLESRLRSRGLIPDADAVALLAERVEGNLLAAVQEVEKLLLLRGPGPVDAEAIRDASSDSARFDPFKLADAALAGERARTVRILAGLRQEGTEPPAIIGALTYALRELANLAWQIEAGSSTQQALGRVWQQRRPLYQQALKRGTAHDWQRLLARAARVDRISKGQLRGQPWDELLHLAGRMAGVQLPDPN